MSSSEAPEGTSRERCASATRRITLLVMTPGITAGPACGSHLPRTSLLKATYLNCHRFRPLARAFDSRRLQLDIVVQAQPNATEGRNNE
jgi:hypothetical protein